MTPEFQKKLTDLLSLNEGREKWMYLDSNRFITIGVGHALFTSSDAVRLPMRVSATGQSATRQQALYAWTALKYQQGDNPVKFHKSLFMEESDIDGLLLFDVNRLYPELIHTFPSFESYPEPARLALYDMVFNLGSFRKFVHFTPAVLAEDWDTAARECVRKVGAERNQRTIALFRQSAASQQTG